MLFKIAESTAARRRVPFYLVDATDGLTPETGEVGGQPQLSKNGGAWANTAGVLVAVGNGQYYVELTAGELDTLGRATCRYKSANTAESPSPVLDVVAFDPFDATALGLTRVDAAVTSRSTVTTANVETAVSTIMNTAIPGSPTANSINERIATMDTAYTAARGAALDYLDASVAARATPAQVNAEVVDVLDVDATWDELTPGARPVNPTITQILRFIYQVSRNKMEITDSTITFYQDDGTTPCFAFSRADDGSTYTRGEVAAP
jgi:hypothetical protein